MQRRRALKPRSGVDARLWTRLNELKEQGWHFRKGAPFKTFTLDFVEHEARLVIDLLEDEPGRTRPLARIVRDRLLSEQGYVILRLWRVEAERDLHSAVHRIRGVLEDLAGADS